MRVELGEQSEPNGSGTGSVQLQSGLQQTWRVKMDEGAVKLAKEVLTMLALQKEYFRTRDATKLRECRDMELRVTDHCRRVLNPAKETETQGDLFQ